MPVRVKQKICSLECSKKYIKSNEGKTQPILSEYYVCSECGKVFLPRKVNQVSCSKDCYQKWYYKNVIKIKRKENMHKFPVECSVCGKIFLTNDKEKKICSGKCKKVLKIKIKKCPVCGIEFETTRTDKIYCSSKCKNKHKNDVRNKKTIKEINV